MCKNKIVDLKYAQYNACPKKLLSISMSTSVVNVQPFSMMHAYHFIFVDLLKSYCLPTIMVMLYMTSGHDIVKVTTSLPLQ